MQIHFQSEQVTEQFASLLAPRLKGGLCIFLYGELGAGKTTLVRALLKSLGVPGAVKSPTYTLVEPYELPDFTVYHLDLYRIADSAELEFLGMEECFSDDAVTIIEWPERGDGSLPMPDLKCQLEYGKDNNGRWLSLSAHSQRGEELLQQIKSGWGNYVS